MASATLPTEFGAVAPDLHVWTRLSSPETDHLVEPETALVERAQAGDRQAFSVLIDRHWPKLQRWLCHLTHNQHGAEDLAQETFLKAYTKLDTFKAGSNFRAWLYRIAYNNFVNQWREEVRARQPFPDNLPAPGQEPPEQAMSQEGLRILARAVGRLPPDFRAAFLLRVEEDLSFRQVAEVLQITETTARWRVFKARQKLMSVL